jgi:hypothetical protein
VTANVSPQTLPTATGFAIRCALAALQERDLPGQFDQGSQIGHMSTGGLHRAVAPDCRFSWNRDPAERRNPRVRRESLPGFKCQTRSTRSDELEEEIAVAQARRADSRPHR